MAKQLTYSIRVIIIILFWPRPSWSRSNVLGTKFTIFDNGVNPEKKYFIPETARIREELGVVCYVSVRRLESEWSRMVGREREPGQLEQNARRRPMSWDSEGPGK